MAGKSTNRTQDMVYIALFAVIMAICAWIVIPMTIPFTMQTLGVFLAAGVLGGRRGTAAVLLYLFLGIIGLPVFSGFTGGPGILLGNTGGYLIGFLCIPLTLWIMEHLLPLKSQMLALSMVLGLLGCYTFGTIWFIVMYSKGNNMVSVGIVIGTCVVPFVIPDLIKIMLALMLRKRLIHAVRLN